MLVRLALLVMLASVLCCAGALLAAGPAMAACGAEGKIGDGLASTYSAHHVGKPTASGERLKADALTAAHPRLPFGTMVKVTHRRNGKTVTVRINDRGPFIRGRIIDLSPTAAQALGFSGLAPVSLDCTG